MKANERSRNVTPTSHQGVMKGWFCCRGDKVVVLRCRGADEQGNANQDLRTLIVWSSSCFKDPSVQRSGPAMASSQERMRALRCDPVGL